MRDTIIRVTAPLVARMPDLREVPLRRQVIWAIVVSLGLHSFAFLGIGVVSLLLPSRPKVDFAKSKPKPRDLEIEIQLPAEPVAPMVVAPAPESRPQFIDSTGLAASKAAEKAVFEADQDMVAASEKAGTGDVPLPSQDGRKLPGAGFENQDVILGKGSENRVPTPETEPARLSLAAPPPVPLYKPQPVAPDASPTPPPSTPQPEKVEAPKPTPAPVVKPDVEDKIVLREPTPPTPTPLAVTKLITPPPRPQPVRKATPEPTPTPVATPEPEPQPPEPVSSTPAPRPAVAEESKFQSHEVKTQVDGSIDNLGRAAVDAKKTALGTYKQKMSQAIKSRWTYYVKQRMDLIRVGTVNIKFKVDRNGKVKDVKVLSNTSNQTFANLCEQSIKETELAPPPEESVPFMKDGCLEIGPIELTLYNLE